MFFLILDLIVLFLRLNLLLILKLQCIFVCNFYINVRFLEFRLLGNYYRKISIINLSR